MWFKFALAETGRKVPWRYQSASHLDTELFEITPASPIVLFMYKPADTEFWPVPDHVPGRALTLALYEGSLPEGVELTYGQYPGLPAKLTGAPLEGGIWEFTVQASLT